MESSNNADSALLFTDILTNQPTNKKHTAILTSPSIRSRLVSPRRCKGFSKKEHGFRRAKHWCLVVSPQRYKGILDKGPTRRRLTGQAFMLKAIRPPHRLHNILTWQAEA